MQFMSQAVGIADCILLAVAPIGAITTVVSAIRVAGPTWLKSFIGRARENLAAAEVEVMSSTSKETCELWNGHRVVRCPGSANIYQFICLISKDIEVKNIPSTLAQNGFTIRYKTLKAVAKEMDIEDKTSLPPQDPQAAQSSTLLQKKGKNYYWSIFSCYYLLRYMLEKTGPKYIAQFFKDKTRLLWKRTRSAILDVEKSPGVSIISHINTPPVDSTTSISHEKSPDPTTHIMPSSNDGSSADSQQTKEIEMVIITDDLDEGAPNLLLNCHDRVGRREIYLAAALGIILQFGAVLYFGVITYHKPIKHHFLKDGKNVVKYAFPCAAIGTMLLVFGLFICSWVVGESTKETFYEAGNHNMFVIWLQKDHTVSDQEFRPYAIYPASKRDYFTMSRRNIKDRPKEIRDLRRKLLCRLSERPVVQLFQAVLQEAIKSLKLKSVNKNELKDGRISSGTSSTQSSDGSNEQALYWPLKFITVVGSFISLMGFVSQFIGMRGLNWTASIVQLGITIVVTILRVIVRRGLGKAPNRTVLKPKYELDWFVLSFGNLAATHWINSDEESAKEIDDSGDKPASRWEICTGGERTYPPLKHLRTNSKKDSKTDNKTDSKTDDERDSDKRAKKSLPHQIMLARKHLGKHSKWSSPVLEEAVCLSRAIEAVANTFLGEQSKVKYEWTIPAIYTANKSPEPVKDNVYIIISRDEQYGWRVDEAEIEAMLSLWLYSTSSTDRSKTNRPRRLRLYGPTEPEERLIRDLGWWMRENIPKIYKYTEEYVSKLTESEHTAEDVTKLAEKESQCTVVGFKMNKTARKDQQRLLHKATSFRNILF